MRFTPGPPRSGYVPAHFGGIDIVNHRELVAIGSSHTVCYLLKSLQYLHPKVQRFNDLHRHETWLGRVQLLILSHRFNHTCFYTYFHCFTAHALPTRYHLPFSALLLISSLPRPLLFLCYKWFLSNTSKIATHKPPPVAMTRTEPTNSTTSWETKCIAAIDDGHRIDSVSQDPRPRGRIRRSMTACNTCRKLKTRCDLDPRGHACRRCLSLRFVILPADRCPSYNYFLVSPRFVLFSLLPWCPYY